MSYIRVNIDLAFKQPLAPAVLAALNDLKAKIITAKAYCEKINAGQPNEENTVRASYHQCFHDEGSICGPEQTI